LRKYKNNVLN